VELIVQCEPAGKDTPMVLQEVEVPLKIAQTAAVLEVVHSILGIVRSPVMITGAWEPSPGAAVSHSLPLP
jgi:hypothetical protein